MEVYYILLMTTGTLSPFFFVIIGESWPTAIWFTICGHFWAAAMLAVLGLANLL